MRRKSAVVLFLSGLALIGLGLRVTRSLLSQNNTSGRRPLLNVYAVIEDSIIVEGADEWIKHIRKSMWLLREKSPDAYRILRNHVGMISDDTEGTWPYTSIKPEKWPYPVVFMPRKMMDLTVTECAGRLAHESYHAYLHDPRLPPPNLRMDLPDLGFQLTETPSQEEEKVCFQHQLKVAIEVGAPQKEIDFIRKQDGSHLFKFREQRERQLFREYSRIGQGMVGPVRATYTTESIIFALTITALRRRHRSSKLCSRISL